MSKPTRQIYIAAPGLASWQAGLAKPGIQWKRGRSAFELAVCWELAALQTGSGVPACVSAVLDQEPNFKNAAVLVAIPEHKVQVAGKGFASQTDLWALLRHKELISLAVEGKAGEDFGPTIDEWLGQASGVNSLANRQSRLAGLCDEIGCQQPVPTDLRYQLFHRTASAVIEAKRCGPPFAVMLVQLFGKPENDHFGDFEKFAHHLGVPSVVRGQLHAAGKPDGISLCLGWVDCPVATDTQVAAVAVTADEEDDEPNS